MFTLQHCCISAHGKLYLKKKAKHSKNIEFSRKILKLTRIRWQIIKVNKTDQLQSDEKILISTQVSNFHLRKMKL